MAIPPRAVELLERLATVAQGEFVFRAEKGEKPLRYVRDQFRRACAKARIEDFHFHDLRHTAISYMMMNGIDLKTIAELVGHTTAQMVDQRYGHLSPDHKRAAAEIFGSAMDRLCGNASGAPEAAQAGNVAPRGAKVMGEHTNSSEEVFYAAEK